MSYSTLECIDKLPDGAVLFRDRLGPYACGWTYSDVLRRGVWYETEQAARMAWEMGDKAAAYRSALRGAGYRRVIKDGVREVWEEVYS